MLCCCFAMMFVWKFCIVMCIVWRALLCCYVLFNTIGDEGVWFVGDGGWLRL